MSHQVIDATNVDLHTSGFIGGFYIRPMVLAKAGESHHGHEHYIDHFSNLVRGQVRIEWRNPATGEEGIVDALVPCKIHISANKWHKITALVDDTYFECTFSEAEAEKVYGDKNSVPWHLEKDHG